MSKTNIPETQAVTHKKSLPSKDSSLPGGPSLDTAVKHTNQFAQYSIPQESINEG